MKNLLKGALVILLFAISVLLVQTSCSKTEAEPLTATQIDKLLYIDFDSNVWMSNYDGTNRTQINFALPPNIILLFSIPRSAMKLSPDGTRLFFSVMNTVTNETGIYSSDINGNNVTPVMSLGGTQPILCGVY